MYQFHNVIAASLVPTPAVGRIASFYDLSNDNIFSEKDSDGIITTYVKQSYTEVAIDFTVNFKYETVFLNSSAVKTGTFVTAVGNGCKCTTLINKGNVHWLIYPYSGQTINGSSFLIIYPGESYSIVSDNTNLYIK